MSVTENTHNAAMTRNIVLFLLLELEIKASTVVLTSLVSLYLIVINSTLLLYVGHKLQNTLVLKYLKT